MKISWKTMVLIIVESVAILSILIQFSLIITYYCLPTYNNESMIALSNNLNADPIMDIDIIDIDQYNSETLLIDKGYETFCNCSNTITVGKCNSKQHSCYTQTISNSERNLRRWKGKNIILKRGSRDVYRYKTYYDDYCKFGKSCGKINNKTFLCLGTEDRECPINRIVVNNQPKYNEDNITFITKPFADNLYLHYTREDPNGTIVLSFNVSEKDFCLNALQQNVDYFLYKGRGSCNNEYDHSYKVIDTINKNRFYEDNYMIEILQQLPNYPIDTLNTSNLTLYTRGFLVDGIYAPIFVFSTDYLLSTNSKSNYYNTLRFLLVILLIIESILYFLFIKFKYKDINLYFKERTLVYNVSACFKFIIQIPIIIVNAYLNYYTGYQKRNLYSFETNILPGIRNVILEMSKAMKLDIILIIIGFFSVGFEIFFLIRNCFTCKNREQYNEERFNKSVLDAPLPIAG